LRLFRSLLNRLRGGCSCYLCSERLYIDGLPFPREYVEDVEEEWCERYIIV